MHAAFASYPPTKTPPIAIDEYFGHPIIEAAMFNDFIRRMRGSTGYVRRQPISLRPKWLDQKVNLEQKLSSVPRLAQLDNFFLQARACDGRKARLGWTDAHSGQRYILSLFRHPSGSTQPDQWELHSYSDSSGLVSIWRQYSSFVNTIYQRIQETCKAQPA